MIASLEPHEHLDRDADNIRYNTTGEITPKFLAMLDDLSRKAIAEPDAAETPAPLPRRHGHSLMASAFAITLVAGSLFAVGTAWSEIPADSWGYVVLGANP